MREATTQASRSLENGFFYSIPEKILKLFRFHPRPSVSRKTQSKLLAGTWVKDSVLSSPVSFDESTFDELRITFGISDNSKPSFIITSGSGQLFPTVSSWRWVNEPKMNQIVLPEVSSISGMNIDSMSSEHLTISFTHGGDDCQMKGYYQISLAKV